MPLYAYRCVKCGHEFEKIEKVDAPTRQKCPKCKKGRAERQLAAPAIQFKGSGWYVTDYAGKKGSAEKPADKETTAAKGGKDGKESKEAKESKEEKPKKEKKASKEK